MDSAEPMKHVVIVGGGFAGVRCAQDLARSGKVRVTLLDWHNYHQFRPLFYQVAIPEMTSGDFGSSLRKIFRKSPNVNIKLADVNTINPKSCMVPAAVVDSVLDSLTPLLERGDIVVDGGNPYYHDDIRRAEQLKSKGIN
jgi:NADH dehydrogenase FAD-containing subunit